MKIDSKTGSVFVRVIPVLLGIAFLAIGANVAVKGWSAQKRMRDSREWPTAEATVLRSAVEVKSEWHSRRNGRAGSYQYSPEIAYAYTVEGVWYEGNREDFVTKTSSDQSWAEGIVSEHPVGSTLVVRYDPTNPSESLWSDPTRKGRASLSFVPLGAGAIFMLIGAAIVSAGLWPERRKERRREQRVMPGGRLPRADRGGEFWGMAIFSLLWYGILSVIAMGFLGAGPEAGRDFWLPMAFLGIVVVAGLWPLWQAVRSGTRLFAPHYDLMCPRPYLVRGEETTITYRLMNGRPEDVSELCVSLVGRRKLPDRYNTRNQHQNAPHPFVETPVLEVRNPIPQLMAQGFFQVTVDDGQPADGRQSDGSQVDWRLVVHGTRLGKPDINDTYPVEVR